MSTLPLTALHEGTLRTTIQIGNVKVGQDFLVIAGPCAVESEEQIFTAALAVKKSGANMLRGGAYKPRSSPYDFQGLGAEGLRYLHAAGKAAKLPVITEVVDPGDVAMVCEYVDMLQIGTRNMQNFALLKEVGRCSKPVLLKRGMSATIEEWLASAEYIMKEGNANVVLCERGIRTMETYTRNTLDVSAVAALKLLTHLPIVVDPSHATGRVELVAPMALSAIMAGCDGLEIEVHPHPTKALSDANQQLTPKQFAKLAKEIETLVNIREELTLLSAKNEVTLW